jgi:hypothetical protein
MSVPEPPPVASLPRSLNAAFPFPISTPSVPLPSFSGTSRSACGIAHGSTDEFGWDAVEDRVHVHDLHATILYLLGLDHEKLTYRHSGRDYRLTDVYGTPVKAILA